MRGVIVLLAGLALAGTAQAAPPAVTVAASPGAGIAPLRVTLTATGDAATYTWSLGDGATAEGPEVTHVYGAGTFSAAVTATNAAGEVAQAQVVVSAARRTVTLEAPRRAHYGEPGVLWYPMYFKGGFAIHGYPSVPAYPASRGCVRIPMWIAASLFQTHEYGTTIVVHL